MPVTSTLTHLSGYRRLTPEVCRLQNPQSRDRSSVLTPSGTWDILCSCCFTLSLCVFTAIHLNVGPGGERTHEWWLRKSKWVAIAIISPEVVLYTAGKQWFSAQRLCKKLGRLSTRAHTRAPVRQVRRFWSRAAKPKQTVCVL